MITDYLEYMKDPDRDNELVTIAITELQHKATDARDWRDIFPKCNQLALRQFRDHLNQHFSQERPA